ncbi:hypothetical protein GQ42DRAFT_33569 [Ramicandelaber brevisporus]|nr:hypothetical protein GQ42DRAFT_33569 [Ramicandelaber brevisporus]
MTTALPSWVRIREALPSDATAIAKVHMYSRAHAYRDFTPDEVLARLPSQFEQFSQNHRTTIEVFNAIPHNDRTGLILVAVGTPPETTSTPIAGGERWEDGVEERIVAFGHFRIIDPGHEGGGTAFRFPADREVIDEAKEMAARGDGKLFEVNGIQLVPEAQGTGIAQHLWGQASRWALDEMHARATVVVSFRDNMRATQFYRRKLQSTSEKEFTMTFLSRDQTVVIFKYDHATMLKHAKLRE